jgi:flagellar basal body-associated protein FliL
LTKYIYVWYNKSGTILKEVKKMPAALWVVLVVVIVVAVAVLGHAFGWWGGGGGHPHPDENVGRAVDGFFGIYHQGIQDPSIEEIGGGMLTISPGNARLITPRIRRRVQQQQQQQQNQQQQN